jgi:hypothetical protein
MLPKDKQGRMVLCYDASRLENDCVESRARCFTYMLRVALKDESRKLGIVILLVMNKLSFQRVQKDTTLPHLVKAHPTKIDSVHIIRQPARLGARLFDEKVVPTLTKLFQPLEAAIHVHSGTASKNLLEIMRQSDFEVASLPRSLGKFQIESSGGSDSCFSNSSDQWTRLSAKGGGWLFQDFQQWLDQRRVVECCVTFHEGTVNNQSRRNLEEKSDTSYPASMMPNSTFRNSTVSDVAWGSALGGVCLPQLCPTGLNQLQIAQLRGQGLLHRPAASGVGLGGIPEMLQASHINAAALLPNDAMLYIGPGAHLVSGQRPTANDRFALEGFQGLMRAGNQINPRELIGAWNGSASRIQPSELGNRWGGV